MAVKEQPAKENNASLKKWKPKEDSIIGLLALNLKLNMCLKEKKHVLVCGLLPQPVGIALNINFTKQQLQSSKNNDYMT